jgi:p-hydroxybenzoate 3-monooxygenase
MIRGMRATVVIVGAGPAGLVLANALQAAGVDYVLLEQRDETEVMARRRAGVVEDRTVRILRTMRLAARLDAQGTRLGALEFVVGGRRHRIDYGSLIGAKNVVYPQHELVVDLLGALRSAGGEVRFGVTATRLELGGTPRVHCLRGDGREVAVEGRILAGCDGFHGASRAAAAQAVFARDHDTDWMTILAAAPPMTRSNVYAVHPRGFAAQIRRTADTTRFYLQVPKAAGRADWSDARIWHELETRLASDVHVLRGDILETSLLEMRVHIGEPMRAGPLFLLGDAAHVLTPCGGKGMNLAIQDADALARAIVRCERTGDERLLAGYSARRVPAAWAAQRFSDELLSLVQMQADAAGQPTYDDRLRAAALDRLLASPTAQAEFGKRYVGVD